MSERHIVEVRTSLVPSYKDYAAYCSCGWEGRTFKSKMAAANDGTEHVLAAISPDDEP